MPLARFARLDADGGVVTPGPRRPAHPPPVRGLARGRAACCASGGAGYLEILAAGGGILSTVAATRAASEEELAAHGRRWLDEMLPPRRHDGRGEVRLRPRPPDRAAPPRGRPRAGPRGAGRRRCRRSSAPTRSRRSSAPAPTAPRRTCGTSSRSSCPGVAAQGRAALVRRVLRAGRVHARTRAGGSSRPPPATGWRSGSTRTSSPRPAARSSRRSSARCPRTTSTSRPTRGSPRSPRRRRRSSPTVATLLPGDDLVPHGRRRRAGPAVHRRRACRSRSARTSTRAPRPPRTCRS